MNSSTPDEETKAATSVSTNDDSDLMTKSTSGKDHYYSSTNESSKE